ncbi:MAG TPA: alanine--tRNA ligase, partial [Gammaproteobacteria bacterium]|nr:alanine--tRNA ligase [Gammaproteobacteria bacterium]
AASQFEAEGTIAVDVDESTVFTGYGELAGQSAVLALAREGEAVETLAAGAEGVVVLEATPFYAESGGQVGDQGYLYWDNGKFEVAEVHYLAHKVIAHRGRMIEGELVPGTAVTAEVNVDGRAATAANHSATHLLHAALRQMLGEHVQ